MRIVSDIIVSIRMPRTLARELRKLASHAHFMDTSEEIRSIIRQKYLSWKEGFEYED